MKNDIVATLNRKEMSEMRVYDKKENKVFVFDPIRKKQKFGTNEQWLKSLNTNQLAEELAKIAEWDRSQLKKVKCATGVVAFMKKWLEEEHKGE